MRPVFSLTASDDALLQHALDEDLSPLRIDLTTDCLFADNSLNATACIISKHPKPITIAGLCLINPLFEKLGSKCEQQLNYHDGEVVNPGETIVSITASTDSLLRLERTLLNFLRHLSGIATLTAEFVSAVKNSKTRILDTRKTTPGLRNLEKYAVRCGGGVNHRFGLFDAIMVKDTHVDRFGGMQATLKHLAKNYPTCPIIIEVRDKAELQTVIEFGREFVNQVLLDNMSNQLLQECVELAQPYFMTEASGNISLASITGVAQTGVDYASVGQITHSAQQVDLSMKMEST